MQNEPNLLDTQMNLTPVKTKNYENNQPPTPRKNEPNLRKTNPIYAKTNLLQQIMKNMQNEPNLLGTKINVSSFITKYYENKCPSGRWQNEPKTNPICGK